MPEDPAKSRPLGLVLWARSDVGRVRSENQDSFLVACPRHIEDQGLLLTPESPELAPPASKESPEPHREPRCRVGPLGALLLVADGMGGAAGGAEAARLAVATVAEAAGDAGESGKAPTAPRFVGRLEAVLKAANRRIQVVAAGRPELRGMGTTATLAGVLGDAVHLAQVGDSRAYLVREGTAVRLTRDQSLVQELVDRGELTPEEAERSPRRHVLLQALGTEPDVDVALSRHPLRASDHLLLCSDGLTGVISDAEIGGIVAEAEGPRAACDRLAALVDERGAPDNVTLVVARIDGGRASSESGEGPSG